MDENQIQNIVWEIQVLYKTTMELYGEYFKALELAMKYTPDSEVEKLQKITQLAREAEEALKHDLGVFEKVVSTDVEGLHKFEDELKIQSIYKTLQPNG